MAAAAAADFAAACSGASAAAAAASEAGQHPVSEEVDQRLTTGLQHYGSGQWSHPEARSCPWTGGCLYAVCAGSAFLPLTASAENPGIDPGSGLFLLTALRRTCSMQEKSSFKH